MRSRRGIVVLAVAGLLAAVALGAVAHDTAAPARATADSSNTAATIGEVHTLSAVAPIVHKMGAEIARRAVGVRGDFRATAAAAFVLAIGVAMRLRRDRRPLNSGHVLQSIVRGRSPPHLLVVL